MTPAERWARRDEVIPYVRAACALGAVVAGGSGLALSVGFSQPSAVKWLLALAACTAAGCIVLAEHPRTAYACLVVLLAPFADFTLSAGPVVTSPLVPVLLVGVPVVLLTTPGPGGGSTLGRVAPLFVVLILPALLLGTGAPATILLLVTAGLVAWTCVRADARDPAAVRSVYLALLATIAVQAVLAVYEFATGRPLSIYGGGTSSYAEDYFFGLADDVARVAGTFFDPISLGNVLALGLPMAAALVLGRRGGVLLRVGALAVATLLAIALTMTYSRMSWNGAALGLLVVPLVLCRGRRLPALGAVVAFVVAVGAAAVALSGAVLQARFASIFDPTGTETSGAEGDLLRERIWAATVSAFGEHPYTGVGLGNLAPLLERTAGGAGAGSHAHSLYLQVAAEVGLPGLVALLLLAIAVIRDARSAATLLDGPDGALVAGVTGALASLAVSCLTDYTARYTAVLAIMLVPLVLLALLAKRAVRSRAGAVPPAAPVDAEPVTAPLRLATSGAGPTR